MLIILLVLLTVAVNNMFYEDSEWALYLFLAVSTMLSGYFFSDGKYEPGCVFLVCSMIATYYVIPDKIRDFLDNI